jgi:hypothetical protein
MTPPIDPSILSVPLSAYQKSQITAYLKSFGVLDSEIAAYIILDNGGKAIGTFPVTAYDTSLIKLYKLYIAGGRVSDSSSPPVNSYSLNNFSPFKSVTDFLNLLADPALWLRIIEIALGAGLVWIAISHMTGVSIPSPRKVFSK